MSQCASLFSVVVLVANLLLRDRIFFDGALPPSKQAVRLERLEKTRAKLEEFWKTYQKSYKITKYSHYPSKILSPEQLFDATRPVPLKFKGLPEPPFMVPSVIEDLKLYWTRHKARELRLAFRKREHAGFLSFFVEDSLMFSSVVEVVPGEADVFCARRAGEVGAAVLTSDSDLLVYRLSKGWVIFFQDIERAEDEEQDVYFGPAPGLIEAEGVGLTAKAYQYTKIQRRFETADGPDFTRIIYERLRDSHASLQQLRQRALKTLSATEGSRFEKFRSDYCTQGLQDESPKPPHALIDPRLSELVYQYWSSTFFSSDGKLSVYLPIMVEDPSRACAWTVGAQFRRLAYSILNLSMDPGRRRSEVFEYTRKGRRVVSAAFALCDVPLCTSALKALTETLCIAKEQFSWYGMNWLVCWRTFAFYEVCLHRQRSQTQQIKQAHIQCFLESGYLNNQLTWDDVHLYAQVQCALYSVRILKHLLSIALPSLSGDLLECSTALNMELENLPSVRLMMQSRSGIGRTDINTFHHIDNALNHMFALLEDPQSTTVLFPETHQALPTPQTTKEQPKASVETRKRRGNTLVASNPDPENLRRRTNNIFENLESD